MKNILSILSVLGLLTLVAATGCTPAENTNAATESGKAIATQTIKVGTMGTYEPFTFHDTDGKLTGYDIEVLREIDKRLPEYEFEYIAGPWDSLFVGLDADRFQLLANQITSNPDRVARYLLTDNSYFADISQPIVRADEQRIKTLADLDGKAVAVTVGDSHARVLEEYNATHGNKISIKYYESDVNPVLQDLVNGRIDATINNPIMARKKADTMGLAIKAINVSLIKSPTHYIMKQDAAGQKLKQAIDQALTEMKADGSLSRLSQEWFGQDYTEL